MEILIFIFPFLSFFISLLPFSSKYLNIVFFINCFCIICSFCLSVYLFIRLFELKNDIPLYFYPLIESNQYFVDWSLRLDLYVSTFILIVTFVSSFVAIYSINFFKDRYLNLALIRNLSLLTFGMLIMVSSNNLIQFFIAWQIILFSFFLFVKRINGNDFILKNNNIFLYNRFSDFGFFLSVYLLYTLNNSIYFETIFENNNFINNNIFFWGMIINKAELAVFLLFFSLLLRFRQFFISNCIYDIKNINIPALTLIFCSSLIPLIMFCVFRFFPLIHSTPNFLNTMITLTFCLIFIFIYLSFKTTNIKSLISYLTSSQACIVFYIFCLKEYHGAMFYFITLSLSITMLYLSLGFVISKLNNISNVKDMGGLIFKMPSMFLFTSIAFLSISGIPFFSGYYSHEVIISSLHFSQHFFLIPSLLLAISISFLVSYVILKNIILIFFGNNNGNIHQFNKINESSFTNKLMFFCLGICIVFTGFFIKNLFDGANAEYMWSSLIYDDVSFSIHAEVNSSDNFKELLMFSNLLGMFFAFANHIIMPFVLNNYKYKYYKIFILYNKLFLRF